MRILRIPALVLAMLLAVVLLPARPVPPPPAPAARVPVVVELFTSEGCNTCPPADALLAELDQKQPFFAAQIIPLEEHVDYWDHDGWHDPFSSSTFTDRQYTYARRFGLSTPYTPEMVVGGRTEFNGAVRRRVPDAISAAVQAPQAAVVLTVASGSAPTAIVASVRVDSFPPDVRESANVRLAITEDALSSNVGAGENKGRHLEHRAVVRKFVSAGKAEPGKPYSQDVKISLEKNWNREKLHVVVFLEVHSTGQILGAASSPISQ